MSEKVLRLTLNGFLGFRVAVDGLIDLMGNRAMSTPNGFDIPSETGARRFFLPIGGARYAMAKSAHRSTRPDAVMC